MRWQRAKGATAQQYSLLCISFVILFSLSVASAVSDFFSPPFDSFFLRHSAQSSDVRLFSHRPAPVGFVLPRSPSGLLSVPRLVARAFSLIAFPPPSLFVTQTDLFRSRGRRRKRYPSEQNPALPRNPFCPGAFPSIPGPSGEGGNHRR